MGNWSPTVVSRFDEAVDLIGTGKTLASACASFGISIKSLERYAKADPGRLRRLRQATWSKRVAAKFDAIVQAIAAGATKEEACRAHDVSVKSLFNFTRSNPEAAARMQAAQKSREGGANPRLSHQAKFSDADYEKAVDTIRAGGLLHTGQPAPKHIAYRRQKRPEFAAKLDNAVKLRARAVPALFRDPLFSAVNAVVPKSLDPSTRGDVVSEIVMMVLAGTITVEDLGTQKRAILRDVYARVLPSSRIRSLDETGPLGTRRWVDALTDCDPGVFAA